MKKILLIMLCLVLLVTPLISAADWDNKLAYSENDLKVTISNSFLLLFPTSEIGTAELKSHSFVDEIIKVGGGDQVTMWYEFSDFKELYKDGLGEVYFTDMRTGKLIDRDYSFVYWGEKERDVYDCEYSFSTNGTKVCNSVVVGKETYNDWLPYNSKDIPKRNIRIGLMTSVEVGDKVDGIWTIAGKKVSKHAVWTAGLDVGLISYYKLDETTGTTAYDELGINNLTNTGMTINQSGKIGTSYLGGNDKYMSKSGGFTALQGSHSVSLWMYHNTLTTYQGVYQVGTGDNLYYPLSTADGEIYIVLGARPSKPETPTGAIVTGMWQHIVITRSGNDWEIWVNGTNRENHTESQTILQNGLLLANNFGNFATRGLQGRIDEVGVWNRTLTGSEIILLSQAPPYGVSKLDIILISPEDTANLTTNSINFSANVSDDGAIGIQNVTLEVYNSTTLVFNETNSSGIEGVYNFSDTFTDGDYDWNVTAYDDANESYSSETRIFLVDTIFPQINISHPIDEQNFLYLINLNNITLNTTITDTNLDTCWYEYNSTNTTFSCSSGVLSENNLTLTNQSIVIVYANDTSGQLNSSQSDWTFDLFDFNNYTYDTNIAESSPTTFIGTFQTGTSLSSTYLEYNNTNYSVSINSLGGNQYILSSTITSPIVSTNTNITWFFWINNINATPFNQTILDINLDNCSSYTYKIINYTLIDELTQELINNANSTIESEVILKTLTGEEVAKFTEITTGNSTPQVCSEINLTGSGLKLWEQSRYGSDDYVFEQHNLQNASISGGQTDMVLRDLPSTSATTFRITYKSSTFLPVSDAIIQIQRKYTGEGLYKEIESPITDANGEASASLDLNAVIYRILVKEAGIITSTFENPAITCQNILTGDCTINLNERQSVEQINNYDIENDFGYSLTQDNRTITLIFDIPSEEAKTINLFVNQSTILGNTTSCNQTILATSGRVDCEIDDTLGDVFFSAKVNVNGNLITSPSGAILEDRSIYFGTDNIVLTFFLVLSLILLMISDPIAVLIGIIIGLIGSSLMLLLNSGNLFGTTSVLMYVVLIVIILIIKISNRQR